MACGWTTPALPNQRHSSRDDRCCPHGQLVVQAETRPDRLSGASLTLFSGKGFRRSYWMSPACTRGLVNVNNHTVSQGVCLPPDFVFCESGIGQLAVIVFCCRIRKGRRQNLPRVPNRNASADAMLGRSTARSLRSCRRHRQYPLPFGLDTREGSLLRLPCSRLPTRPSLQNGVNFVRAD